MAFTIREATAADKQAIKVLVREAKLNPLGIHWPGFVVAEDAGHIVGMGQIKMHGDGSRELASIATIPSRQGEGIATAIIQALLAVDAHHAPAPLYLTCRTPMEPFYKRFGFCRVERLADMPPYFRRLMRIARVVYAIGGIVGIQGGLVMVREGR